MGSLQLSQGSETTALLGPNGHREARQGDRIRGHLLPVRLRFQLLVALGVTPACGMPPAEAIPPACDGCHDLAALAESTPGEGVGAREWTAEAGRGLVLRPTFVPGEERYALEWPRRGRHDAEALADCGACHPVAHDGTGHGLRRYPPAGDVAPPDDACASCHEWLPADGVSVGFTPASGDAPIYAGSLRPLDLLATGADAHALLFRDGFEPGGPGSSVAVSIAPGCTGCHAISSPEHGAIPSCTDCHAFGTPDAPGSLHVIHAAMIGVRRERNDPADAKLADCAYCHGWDAPPDGPHRMACYGCHLSGHRSEATFWP